MPYSLPAGNVDVRVQTATGADTLTNVPLNETSLSFYLGLVFNPDGKLNSQENPAPKGAMLVAYGTGMGQTNPAGVDGAIIQGPALPKPIRAFSATVQNGTSQFAAQVSYLGAMPGAVAGAVQANILIPDSVPPGPSTFTVAPTPSYGFTQSVAQTIYMLSDPPVLTGVTPAPPIPQTLGQGVYLTLVGKNLQKIADVNFFLNGKPIDLHQQSFSECSGGASCTYFVDFAGPGGDYAVEVVNVANQVSNRITFTVQPIGPPTVSGAGRPDRSAPFADGPELSANPSHRRQPWFPPNRSDSSVKRADKR